MVRYVAIALLLLLGGCGDGSSGQPATVSVSPSPTPTASSAPAINTALRFDANGVAIAPPDAAAVAAYRIDSAVALSLDGFDKIPSNFDRTTEVLVSQSPVNTDGDGALGAFRLTCQAAQLSFDDPIVYPGIVGGSPHLHQWFGNTEANALSTFRSLRTTGQSTCMGPLNRSAYWMPAMIRGDGMAIRPDYLTVYYKRYPKTAPECKSTARDCLPVPRGLRYIFGYDMRRMDQDQPENMIFKWKCVTPENTQRGGLTTKFTDLDCPAGNLLIGGLAAPDCWDGTRLDSPDHRSHMAYQQYGQSGGLPVCPSTHPYLIPQFTLAASYSIEAGEDIHNWYLSSDRMPGMPQMSSGSTFHSDWFGAWDDETLQTWTSFCIDKRLSCVAGQLGDGTTMKRPANFGLKSPPRLISLQTP